MSNVLWAIGAGLVGTIMMLYYLLNRANEALASARAEKRMIELKVQVVREQGDYEAALEEYNNLRAQYPNLARVLDSKE